MRAGATPLARPGPSLTPRGLTPRAIPLCLRIDLNV